MNDSPSLAALLWNPFRRIAGGPALGIGLVVLLVTGLFAAPTRTHFDGVLDTHVGSPAPLWFFLAEGLVNWLSLASTLWIAGAILKGLRAFRALDLYGTQALARWPFVFTAFACYLPPFQSMTAKMIEAVEAGVLLPRATAGEWIAFSLVSIVMLLVTIWFVALSWQSFRISCDARGGKAIGAFVVAILVAEVVSKLAIVKGLDVLLR